MDLPTNTDNQPTLNTLPPTLISNIFEHHILSSPTSSNTRANTRKKRLKVISSLSTHLRDIALSTPRIWTLISSNDVEEETRMNLSRAKAVEVDVMLDCSVVEYHELYTTDGLTPKQKFEWFLKDILTNPFNHHRFHSLTFNFTSTSTIITYISLLKSLSFPNLKSLSFVNTSSLLLNISFLYTWNLGKLDYFEAENVYFSPPADAPTDSDSTSWMTTLQSVSLKYNTRFAWRSIVSFLPLLSLFSKSSPSLTSLKLMFHTNNFIANNPSSESIDCSFPPVTFSNLKTLSITYHSTRYSFSILSLLAWIIAPRLTVLRIICVDLSEDIRAVVNAVRGESFPCVDVLEICIRSRFPNYQHGKAFDYDPIAHLVSKLPSIQHLILNGHRVTPPFSSFLSPSLPNFNDDDRNLQSILHHNLKSIRFWHTELITPEYINSLAEMFDNNKSNVAIEVVVPLRSLRNSESKLETEDTKITTNTRVVCRTYSPVRISDRSWYQEAKNADNGNFTCDPNVDAEHQFGRVSVEGVEEWMQGRDISWVYWYDR